LDIIMVTLYVYLQCTVVTQESIGNIRYKIGLGVGSGLEPSYNLMHALHFP